MSAIQRDTELLNEIERLRAINAELLAALEATQRFLGMARKETPRGKLIDLVDAAIAKATQAT